MPGRDTGEVRILVVEDEPDLADALAKGLRRQALAVDVAADGALALEMLSVNSYDVVVLDRDLPVLHGDDVCRRIVSDHPATRTLMLTASAEVGDRVQGLRLGADDYLGKPFALEELVARVHALGRRTARADPPLLEHAGITLDPVRVQAFRDGHYLGLTKKEFGVLHELLRNPGAVTSAEQLLEKVWDVNTDPFSNVVRVTVMTLRRKLGPPSPIETVTGMGYRLVAER